MAIAASTSPDASLEPLHRAFDVGDPAFVADPYAAFAQARLQGSLLWHDGLGEAVTLTHRAADVVLRERRLGRIFVPREPEAGWRTFNWLHADSILDSEPPKHTRLRRLVAAAFGRGHVERLRPRVAELADGLLDECDVALSDSGAFDVISDYAEPLPVLVIAELLGWPEADRHLLRPWSQAIVRMYEVDRTPEQETAARAGLQRVRRLRARAGGGPAHPPARRPRDPPRAGARRRRQARRPRAHRHGGAAAERRARGQCQRVRQRHRLAALGTRPAGDLAPQRL